LKQETPSHNLELTLRKQYPTQLMPRLRSEGGVNLSILRNVIGSLKAELLEKLDSITIRSSDND